jgi:hypothetical protein
VLGGVDLSHVAHCDISISSIMDATRHVVLATADQEEMARQFERYDLKSAPVIDANKRLVGVVTVDDVVDVIEEEAEEDLLRLGGVGDESVADNVVNTVRNRFTWLCSSTSRRLSCRRHPFFDATIDQMVALAVLMPIVALHWRQCRDPDHDGDCARARHLASSAPPTPPASSPARPPSGSSTASCSRPSWARSCWSGSASARWGSSSPRP